MKLTFFFLLFAQFAFAQVDSGELRGVVMSQEGEPMPFVLVIVYKGDTSRSEFVHGARTDFDGRFVLKPIPAGTYNLEIKDESGIAESVYMTSVVVETDRITTFDKIEMTYPDQNGESYGLPSRPLIHREPFGNKTIIEKEDIRRP